MDNLLTVVLLLAQGSISGLAWNLYRNVRKHNLERKNKEQAMDDAIRCLLRSEIITQCHKAQVQGYLAIYNLENITDMYNAYHALGGNGSITEIYDKARHLPNEKAMA